MQIGTFNSASVVNTSENVSGAVKKDSAAVSQHYIAELKDKQANDIKSNDSFSDAYAIDISDAGYAAYEKNAARVSSADGTNGTITVITNDTPEQNKQSSKINKTKLEHTKFGYGLGYDAGTKNAVRSDICSSIKGLLSISSTMNFNDAYANGVTNFETLANSLNAYAEAYGQNDGFLDDLLGSISELADKSDNVILHKIRSMVSDVGSGNYINLNGNDFADEIGGIIKSAVNFDDSSYKTTSLNGKAKKYYSSDFAQTQNLQQDIDNMELKQEEGIVDKMLGNDTKGSSTDNAENNNVANIVAKQQDDNDAATEDETFKTSVRYLDRLNSDKKVKQQAPIYVVHSLSQEWSAEIDNLTRQYQFTVNDL